MTVGLLSLKSGAPLRFLAANLAGPTATSGLNVTTGTTTARICRMYFSVGSGNASEFRLSFFAFFISAGVGVSSCNGYTINSASLEYNGISVPITFSGARPRVVAAGASDVQSDVLLPSAFSVGSFSQGSTGYIRLALTFANPTTDVAPNNGFESSALGAFTYDYDPAKVIITNGVDGTGPITYTMTGGGVDGTDIKQNGFPMMPALLGKFGQRDPPVWLLAGDSGCYGIGDTVSSEGARGLGRMVYVSATTPVPAGALACWNLGCNSGIASDWQNGAPSLLNSYMKYFNYGLEEYGGNGFLPVSSEAIHATWRGAGFKGIIRTSLTPRTNSTDSWATTTNQTQQGGWGPGSSADTYEQTMKALVASDLVYIDYHTPCADAGNYWDWKVNGTAFYFTPEGLHPSTLGYDQGKINGTGNITSLSGTVAGTLRNLVVSYL
jgi:hypothetical protein